MRILILGGTRFLGRHLVEEALARGHSLTLFNRGKSSPDLFPALETVIGDREHDLALLSGRHWDAVIDTCGYLPRLVRISAEALSEAAAAYVFISTISVYADFGKVGIDEGDPVGTLDDESVEEISGATYGPLKALCERTVEAVLPGRALIVRPGLIVGPYDPTDRFTYWPARVARGGEVLAPEKPAAPVQIIDGRDLAEFIIRLIEQGATGIYNATGRAGGLTMGGLLETCKAVSGSDATFRWATLDFLNQNGVAPWSDMPAWLPDVPEEAGASRVDVSKAIAAGLDFRPLAETVRDTLEWAATRSPDHAWRAGLSLERELELLHSMK